MGYCVDMDLRDVVFDAKVVDLALAAIKRLHGNTHLMSGGSSAGERWFSWVSNDGVVNAQTLVDALAAWRYEAVLDGEDVVVDYFTGEKLGDDSTLWEVLAPFVNRDAVIYCSGEDGAKWKWTFRKGRMNEHSGRVVYDGDDDD